jgi:thioredoxin
MMRKLCVLLAVLGAALGAAAQNKYEEVIGYEIRQNKIILTVTVKGAPHKFLFDVTRPVSAVFPDYAAKTGLQATADSLEKIGIGQNLFILKAAVERLENTTGQPDLAGILGRDMFKGNVITINKRRRSITISSPYKPSYMPLRNRIDMTAGYYIDPLLNTNVVSLDFARDKMYFERYELLAKAATAEPVKKESPAESAVVHLNREAFLRDIFNFREEDKWKYRGDLPCVIDFWATWCGPCRKLDPIIKELAKEYEGRVKFYKVNVDEEKEIARGYFNIQSIPLLLYVPVQGEPVKELGTLSKEDIRGRVEALLIPYSVER